MKIPNRKFTTFSSETLAWLCISFAKFSFVICFALNNFQYHRIGVEAHDCVFFFEEDPTKSYANLYKIDEYNERPIRISQGIDLPYTRTEEF